ncbi:MAG: tetratricopeptide repeat protein, partial [Mycobacteriales bacterium]
MRDALNDLDAAVGQADQLRGQGRQDEAEPIYRAVLARQPENFEALLGLGELLRAQG